MSTDCPMKYAIALASVVFALTLVVHVYPVLVVHLTLFSLFIVFALILLCWVGGLLCEQF